ncbi:MAG: DNA alkylation repair protein [Bauldia sp.]|nr:DNA alkylation repair protein [Bauldia sp.]
MKAAKADPRPTKEKLRAILAELEAQGSEAQRAKMAGYGIVTDTAYGVGHGALKAMAKPYGKDHALALALWATGRHEARDLATMIDDPKAVTPAQMDSWAGDCDSWDLVDAICFNLFNRTPYADAKIREWVTDRREFVRRSGFVLIACLALPRLKTPDAQFVPYLALIEAHAGDDRNFVKKGVSWALRTIGKRAGLRDQAIEVAERMAASSQPAARSVGKEALRELRKRG